MVHLNPVADATAPRDTHAVARPKVVGGQSASLRRVDWRFLFPPVGGRNQTIEHLVVLGGLHLSTEMMLQAGVAGQISRSIPRDRQVDAIAILVDAITPGAVRLAAAALRPGGVLYCEINRRRAATWRLTPQTLQRQLRSLSLTAGGVYWPAPNFAFSKRYIPLDDSAALRWYLESLYAPGTSRLQFIRQATQVATQLHGERFAGITPWYAIVAQSQPTTPLSPAIVQSPDCPIDLSDTLSPALLTSGQDDASRAVMAPFAPGQSEPRVVMKISRLAQFNANVLNEQHALNQLHACLDARTRLAIPRPLGTFQFGGLAVGVESAAPGQPLNVSSGRWRASPGVQFVDLDAAITWLIAFHQQTCVDPAGLNSNMLRSRFDLVTRLYTIGFNATQNERRLFQHLQLRAAALLEMPLPTVWQHNDFGPWNIYRRGGDLTVIDWELGLGPGDDREGPPLCDLLYFVTHWSFVARHLYGRRDELRGFHELFVEPDRSDPIINAIHLSISRYLRELKVHRDFLPILLVTLWVERAAKRLERKKCLGDAGESPRTGDQFAGYVSYLADHADAFLAACDMR